jgi:short-subunit dehydrogenase
MARKKILITGASSGLGEALAREYAKRGRTLALCARRTDRLQALKVELESSYPKCKVYVKALDVDDFHQVFEVFGFFALELGGLDRVIVNAGVGDGRRIGTGHFETNLKTATTNFVSALAQCESAIQIFRKQGSGHLVTISSMSAFRGLPKHMTTYAATKAALAALTEGIRADLLSSPIAVSTIFPGYVRTELNANAKKMMFEVDITKGAAALFSAIEREPSTAIVPNWPWVLVKLVIKALPPSWLAKFS